ncbi:4Fe4S-binding leucine-rich repeat protein [Denitromonas iodatirespirans]|uniref:(Fe-S) protein n=1 Tax=Denitromonas iodatirespirans TaxID=2795389 RepID=A0A944D5X9_DENI1|nr:4Fe4S-binding leucine-rich repeat protein [Denitromonas iodatirespirans]MBT0960509.1 (Fe-S) protein [Denitromonas iodatirespirans]
MAADVGSVEGARGGGLCAGCVYLPALLNVGRCIPGDTCIRAHSGRQIDRFLRANPEEAGAYLDDIFWERRAIAARYAPLTEVMRLKDDPDEVVRRTVALRLPEDALAGMIGDPDREVRQSVAARVPVPLLPRMMYDPDYVIRATVARRLPHGQLMALVRDPDREVRKVVAARLPAFALSRLAGDSAPEVRAIVAERALPGLAERMLEDAEWWVRLAAVANALPEALARVAATDPEPEVRDAAAARLCDPAHGHPRGSSS